MNRAICWLSVVGLTLCLFTWAQGMTIEDRWNPASGSDEENLYEVWNYLFNDAQTSSADLFSTHGLPEGTDWLWTETNGAVHLEVRYAGFSQALGIRQGDSETFLVHNIGQKYNYVKTALQTDQPFEWIEYWDSGATSGQWTSNTPLNPLDHFVAFSVPSEFVNNYNDIWNDTLTNSAYLIAFEDLNLGDRDYNDLVAVVDNVAPVPEPATLFLLASGVMGLGLFRWRKLRRS